MIQHKTKLSCLQLILNLLTILKKEEIIYCHWKSNFFLDRSANGENDLDILISLQDQEKFEEILKRLGFKKSTSFTDFITPGICNFFGYDEVSGKLVNVHVHYNLYVGHDFSKNFHFPIEQIYLSSSIDEDLFRIPKPEFEWVIFLMRMVIKHLTWEAFFLKQNHLSQTEKKEFDYLMDNVHPQEVEEILKTHFSSFSFQLFDQCVNVFQKKNFNFKHLLVGQKAIRKLKKFTRKPRIIDSIQIIWRRFFWPFQIRIFRKDFRKHLSKGGKLISIIGGDGAGKSTLVNEISEWLGSEFAVRKFHMGKPDWSIITILVRGFLKMGTMVGLYPFQRCEIKYTNNLDLIKFPGYPWLFREICTARDRFLTFKKASSFASSGGIAILDRYPIQQVQFMDGPQIKRMTIHLQKNGFLNWLISLEESYYEKIGKPDLILFLKLDPNIAVKRKKDEPEESVKARSEEIMRIDFNDQSIIDIDASQSKEMVFNTGKSLVWSIL